MKKFKIILMGVLASTFMWGCASQDPNNSIAEELQREWMLVSFQNFPKEKLIDYQAKMNLIPSENPNQFSAKMGCNNLFFTSKIINGSKIEFSQVGSTMMFCQDKMDLESAFGKALPSMNFYRIEGHYLTLSDQNGDEMKFVAADWD